MFKEDFTSSESSQPIDNKKIEGEGHEETTELLTQLLAINESLIKTKGPEAANALMEMLIQGASEEEILQKVEEMTNIEEAKEKAYQRFEEAGYLEYSPDGDMLCDIDKLKNGFPHNFMQSLGSIYREEHLGNGSAVKALFLLFQNKKVISKDDFEKGGKGKSLLYSPDSREDALDIEKIRQAEFYLTPGDIVKNIRYSEVPYGGINDLDYREVLLPLLLYHPDYENVYRDSNSGILYSRDKEGNERKISAKYLRQKYGALGHRSTGNSLDNPRALLNNDLRNLHSNGLDLLKPSDFELMTGQVEGVDSRPSKRIRKKGVVMFNGVLHNLGAVYGEDRGNFLAYQLSPYLGGIFEEKNGTREMVASFQIFNKEGADRSKSGTPKVGVKEVGLKSFSKNDFFPPLSDETDANYHQRLDSFSSPEQVLEVSEYLERDFSISIHDLSLAEQMLIASAAIKHDYKNNERFAKFVGEYRMDGLHCLVGTEVDSEVSEEFLNIGENMDSKIAWSVFRKYQEIIDLKNEIELEVLDLLEEQSQDFDSGIVSDITFNIIRKANSFVRKFSGLKKDTSDEAGAKVLQELDTYQTDLVLTASIFKEAQRMDEIDLEMLAGVEFKQISPNQLIEAANVLTTIRNNKSNIKNKEGVPSLPASLLKSEILKNKEGQELLRQLEDMLEMYARNYKENPVLQEKLVNGFLDKLKEGDTSVYMCQKDGKVISFLRFDDLGNNKKYFGSFNVTPEGAGSTIGTAMMEIALEKEAEVSKEIEADCEPDKMISSTYIDKRGFIVREVRPNYGNAGITAFNIIRRLDNEDFYYKDYEQEDLISEYEKEFAGKDIVEDKARLILKFEAGAQELLDTSEEMVNEKGYVITRYFFSKDKKHVYCAFEKN